MNASRRIVFVTHAQVEIDPRRPVPDWPLPPPPIVVPALPMPLEPCRLLVPLWPVLP